MPGPEDAAVMQMVGGKIFGDLVAVQVENGMEVIGPCEFAVFGNRTFDINDDVFAIVGEVDAAMVHGHIYFCGFHDSLLAATVVNRYRRNQNRNAAGQQKAEGRQSVKHLLDVLE